MITVHRRGRRFGARISWLCLCFESNVSHDHQPHACVVVMRGPVAWHRNVEGWLTALRMVSLLRLHGCSGKACTVVPLFFLPVKSALPI